MKRKMLILGTIFFAVLIIVSGIMILRIYSDGKESEEAFESIAELIVEETTTDETTAPEIQEPNEESTVPKKITPNEKYASVYEQNNDFVGWISIDGTNINYPVMQTVEHPNYYLKRGFDGKYSEHGVPYVQEDCNLLSSDNIVIYGHNMKDGTMFSDLEEYISEEFYKRYPYIQFDTLNDYGTYVIIVVFKTVAYSEDGFKFYNFVDASDGAEFDNYISRCKELSLYDTGISAEYGDKLLTLSTCEYSRNNGRMVIVAKLITEDTEVDADG